MSTKDNILTEEIKNVKNKEKLSQQMNLLSFFLLKEIQPQKV